MKILIAEDDPVTRRMLRGFLEKWGYEVVAAADGTEAWERFLQGDVAYVVTDWMMPGLNGIDLIKRIRGTQDHVYVYIILLTTLSQKKDVVHGMSAGADDFVTKPFDGEELHVRVQAGERIVRLEQTLREQNRTLRDTQAALLQSQNLASLGQLAAGMAHQINNPLSFVINNFAVLKRDSSGLSLLVEKYHEGRACLERDLPELAAETARLEAEMDLEHVRQNLSRLLDRSLQGLHRVRDVVANLREFARLDQAEFNEVDLNAALTFTIEMLRHEFDSNAVRLETRFGALPLVWCCPAKIDQVFLNLILNAIQASAREGRIIIGTRVDGANSVVVEIEDEGCGVRPEDLPRLFEPFFTTKPTGMSKGLGLAMSYGIVQDHRGAIEVESTLGRGSTFRVRLPIASA